MPFPPTPVYPKAIDSDYTLYLVHNTTETRLSADNSPWAQEIEIVPVAADKTDIWADNGFGNIDGELFYYDSVQKNSDGKVVRLKGCARNLGGDPTKFNKRGTWVRSYVVAEHHNQLVDAIMKTQNFVGFNFDPRPETLDWRIRNLRALDIIWDDYSCPDVNFTFNVVENDPVTGILTRYVVEIDPPGSVNNFRLDFGDGNFTTTELSGEHRYAINARVDPVIRVSNDKCQIIQTPIERSNPAEPPPEVDQVFEFPIQEIPDFPDFTFVPCEVPEPDINLPALVTPCVSIEGQVGPIPSVITGPTINLVSQVTITSTNPINITQSVVQIIGGENIPNLIIIDPPIPPTIIIDPPIPPTIVIVPPESNIMLDVDFANMPRLEVDWNAPPPMQVEMTFAKAVKTPQKFSVDPELLNEFGTEFADLFDVQQSLQVEYEPAGIPSEIRVLMPDDMKVGLDTSELDRKKIKIDATGVNLPTDIFIHGPDSPIPNSISFDASELVEAIDMLRNMQPLKVDATEVPKVIKLETDKAIPDRIVVEIPKEIPNKIVIEHDIPSKILLEGPKSIPVIVPEDVFLPVKFPDKMPEIELVWRGAPIEVKVTMDEIVGKTEEHRNCFTMVPCSVK